ncbi:MULTISPECIES: glycosyltransferase family 4 protein [unclassified Corallococcus]|uniref:glycosyltransferase family 4 protein n=1 Tax=unclassified Corallococcus TaxID=2685029 RepID=UPI001A8DAB69|nr:MULTISPECIES: glycosyltransferase family 1 protein [unclassified Corallococcus]MBN9684226.1 glycosyltransferase family 4 protein [Corallococcus sp. NCSPR001]WAS89473.1 glycosyltransferase family 1 protein [Corallococcus sp. NCRR]
MVRGQLHGIARYALELARRLPALATDLEFSALVPAKGLPDDLGELTPRIPLHRSRAGYLSPTEQPLLAYELTKLKPDLFHATSFSLPLFWPGKLVGTLHDANHLALADQYTPVQAIYYKAVVGPRARLATALITVSDFSREELGKYLKMSPYRFQVIHNGVDERFQPPTASEAKAFRDRHELPERYIAVVGNAKPFKNLAMLAKFAPELPVPLVLLAGKGAVAHEVGLHENVIDLEQLPESEMPLFYGAASMLLLPSRYEGFGLPALEAMASGCPVIAADTTALPEVVGDAALRLEPTEASMWKEASLRLLRDDALRQELMDLGRGRAARFTWDACALRTLGVFRRALEGANSPRQGGPPA